MLQVQNISAIISRALRELHILSEKKIGSNFSRVNLLDEEKN